MKKELIPYNTIEFLSKTMLDYISGNKNLEPFYSEDAHEDGILKLVQNRTFGDHQRSILLEVLTEQYAGYNLSEKERSHLERLGQKNTFTITTGHQLCIMGGPLYFFLKIVSTINLALRLNEKSKENCFVPFFWMASEDHDFEEVNHINLFGKKVIWESQQGNAVGRMSLKDVGNFREELFQILGESDHANEIKTMFDNTYGASDNLAEATRRFVRFFFKEDGLLILDGDHKLLKRSFIEPVKTELKTQQVKSLVAETIASLGKVYKIQANPSEVNLFYLSEGERIKIQRENGQFKLGDKKIDSVELINTVSDHPERISPNVLMRPLFQEYVLPNVAYVGGGGELAYWLELKNLFEENKVPLPALVLRNSLLWIDRKSSKLIGELGIDLSDLFQKEEVLVSKYASGLLDESVNLDDELVQLQKIYNDIENKISVIDPSLRATIQSQYSATEKNFEKLEKKLIKAIKSKNESKLNQLKKLKLKLFPGGKLQERNDSFIPLYLIHGKKFVEILKQSLDPLDFQMTVIIEE